MKTLAAAIAAACLLTASAEGAQQAPAQLARTLAFETPGLAEWSGGPRETLSQDSVIKHGGQWAGRIDRGAGGAEGVSAFTLVIPRTFAGEVVQLRGWLRLEDVDGTAGLWLRQDGRSGVVSLNNMSERNLSGTSDWAEYTIALPLDDRTRSVAFGALLSGAGTLWVDDLELLVDGRAASEAPPFTEPVAPAALDTEFDDESRITARGLSPEGVEHLALLARVWGFVKYHHPAVRAGQHNWDSELFRVLPDVMEAANRDAALASIVSWLERVGVPDPCDPCVSLPPNLPLAPDLGWIADRRALGGPLSDLLLGIHAARPTDGEQYYVHLAPGVGNPIFANEARRPASGLPDAGYRLLALFRYWNVIQYWFPYRDLIEGPWESVLSEFIPRLMEASTFEAYRTTMQALVTRIDDSHANVGFAVPPSTNAAVGELPVVVRWIEGEPVVIRYKDPELGPASGLRLGDVIERLDDQTVDSLVAAWRPYQSASNEPKRLLDIGSRLTRGTPGPVRVTVRRPEGEVTLVTDRIVLPSPYRLTDDLPGPAFQMLSDSVAYLKLSAVEASQVDSYVERAAGASVLVIDIRNYPSEFVAYALGSRLVERPTPFARFTNADLRNPGAFWLGPPVVLQPARPAYRGRVAILVNEVSMSQSEFTAMAFRASPNAIVVGSTTAGADGNVSTIPLPGGLMTTISGIGVYYPDGGQTQRIGIVPDLEVRPTIEGVRAGRDEVLEAAVSYLLGREFRLQVPAAGP
jgi:C-terminal processing protease CtpA/Prc